MPAGVESAWVAGVDEHVEPELATCALLIIDTQVDFVDGGASPIEGTTAILPALASLRTAFLRASRPVVHVVRLYEGDDVDRVRRTAIAAGARVVVPGSYGSQVVPELRELAVAAPEAGHLLAGELEDVGPHEVVMWKPRWSAFHRTRLHEYLTGLGVSTRRRCWLQLPELPAGHHLRQQRTRLPGTRPLRRRVRGHRSASRRARQDRRPARQHRHHHRGTGPTAEQIGRTERRRPLPDR